MGTNPHTAGWREKKSRKGGGPDLRVHGVREVLEDAIKDKVLGHAEEEVTPVPATDKRKGREER